MANFAAKYSIMTQEMVDSFCDSFYIPAKVHLTAPGRDKTITQFPVGKVDMGLLDFIKTADPRKVRAVEVQKGDDQVKLLESTQHCFMPLVIPAAGGSSSAAAAEIPAPTEGGQEGVAEEDAYLELADPDEGTAMVRQSEEEVVTEQSKKAKKRRLQKQSDVLPAKKLRKDHPALASGAGGKTLTGLEQIRPTGSRLPNREQFGFPSVAPPSQESEGFLDSSARTNLRICTIVESSSALAIPVDTTDAATTSTGAAATTGLATDVNLDLAGPSHPEESEGSDDSFYAPTTLDPFKAKRYMDYDQLYTEFNVGAARQVCLGAEVRLRAEDELELKEKLRKEAEAAEVIRLRDQVSSLSEEKSALTAEVSVLKITVTQKDHDISLLNASATSLALASKVSSLRAGFQEFKERMEVQQEQQAQELYNRVVELEAHKVAFDSWDTACSPQIFDYLGLEAGHEHGIAGRSLSAVDAYNPEAAKACYVDAVKALEDVDFPLVSFLKSKKDARMDEVLDSFLLDGPLACLPEAAYLQPCIEQLSVPIHYAGDTTAIGETSMSFALMNVYARAEGAKKHDAALRQLMMDIVSAPLSSQTWVGEASTSAAPLSVEDYDEEDTNEALGSIIAIPKFEIYHF
ncbi:hypothetical protein Tco_0937490 [Tanacetum coccineum]|uniref:Transposase (Putative), gypsy type n=1 Tax=Tanacetum coccineum TaxID=301880 RepID=A0ABQ5DED3_9ASTR